ncbi:energy transducer TonB [Tenacibaculum piscium]|uniref:energy transducer TonB n=1 Tax=Tenacibaculum piscium TaxID=1458515 RepID=UPI001F37C8B6|nr:energy transducer TonB [Tenacibaculum piscium]
MKNILIILITVFSITQIFSQKVCVAKKETVVDVHALALNKCKIHKAVKTTKKITSPTKRYLKKRVYLNKVVHLASNLEKNSLATIKTSNKIDTDLLLVLKEASVKEYIAFDVVENIPLFASCNQSSLDRMECFNNQMEKHIIDNFEYPREALKKGVEANLEVRFVIDKHGKVNNIKIKSDNKEDNKNNDILKKEAMRIVLLLPKFTPGKQKGVTVPVLYKFPMNFTLN